MDKSNIYFWTMTEISKTYNLIEDFEKENIEINFEIFIEKYGICAKRSINLEQKLTILAYFFKDETFTKKITYDCLKKIYK